MAAVDTYDELAGYVSLRSLLSSDDVAVVLDDCDSLLGLPAEEREARDRVAQGTQHLDRLDERSERVGEIVRRPALLDAVTAILGPSFAPEVMSFRSPGPGHGGQKLHTDDIPKLGDGADQVATAIVALEDFNESNGATRIVPGSHRRPDLQRRAGSLESHPDEIMLTGPAGTVFVFSGHLLHSGTVNTSPQPRPALQLVWRIS